MPSFEPHFLSDLRRRVFWGLIGGAVCLGVFGCEQASEPISSPPSSASVPGAPRDGFGQRLGTDVTAQPGLSNRPSRDNWPKIVAFGDSLTAGLGVSPEESYPFQLHQRLDEAGYRYRVINAGISGETTAGGLRRVSWVLSSKPSIVILELGGNDGLRGLDLKDTRSNLEKIIQRLQAAGVTVVLAGMKLPPNYGADYTARFSAMYHELARAYHLTLMPFFLEGVATQAGLNQADGIHPTGAGYRVIVENLMRMLEPLLANSGSARS